MKNNKIITHVELTINPDFINEVLPLADKTRNIILLEDGCENFNLMRKPNEPNILVIFAVYTSKQTYDWHLEQSYIKDFFGFLHEKLIVEPRITYLEEL